MVSFHVSRTTQIMMSQNLEGVFGSLHSGTIDVERHPPTAVCLIYRNLRACKQVGHCLKTMSHVLWATKINRHTAISQQSSSSNFGHVLPINRCLIPVLTESALHFVANTINMVLGIFIIKDVLTVQLYFVA